MSQGSAWLRMKIFLSQPQHNLNLTQLSWVWHDYDFAHPLKFCMWSYLQKLRITQQNFNPSIFWGWGYLPLWVNPTFFLLPKFCPSWISNHATTHQPTWKSLIKAFMRCIVIKMDCIGFSWSFHSKLLASRKLALSLTELGAAQPQLVITFVKKLIQSWCSLFVDVIRWTWFAMVFQVQGRSPATKSYDAKNTNIKALMFDTFKHNVRKLFLKFSSLFR